MARSRFSTNVTAPLSSGLTPFSGSSSLMMTKQCLLALELHFTLSIALGRRHILFSYSSKKVSAWSFILKLTTLFFTELEQRILKFAWKHKWPQIAKVTLRKKNKAGGIMLLDFKLYYKVTVIKTVWYWNKSRHISMEQSREPRNKLTLIWSINLQQRRQECTMEKDSLFNKWSWENLTATCRGIKLDYFLIQYTKINSKWIKDLNVRPETTRLLEEDIGSMLFDISLSNIYIYFWFVSSGKGNKRKTNGTMSD